MDVVDAECARVGAVEIGSRRPHATARDRSGGRGRKSVSNPCGREARRVDWDLRRVSANSAFTSAKEFTSTLRAIELISIRWPRIEARMVSHCETQIALTLLRAP